MHVVTLIMTLAGRAAVAQDEDTPFLVAPAAEGVVLRWAWPEGERPLGYHVERRESGGPWSRLTAQPIVRMRSRADARARLGDAYDRYAEMLFPANPLDELADPESYRSLLLLLADLEPGVAQVLGLRYDDVQARAATAFEYRLIAVTRRGETEVGSGGPVVAGSFRQAGAPDSLQAAQQMNGVALRWSTVGAFSGYHVFRRRGAGGEWERLSGPPVVVFTDENGSGTEASPHYYRDSTATAGDTVTYAVQGIDPFGRSSIRSDGVRLVVRDVIPPAPPLQVTSAVRGDTVLISWVPSPDATVVAYQVWRAAARDGPVEPLGRPLPATTRSALDVGRPAGRLWWYYVTAADAAGNESTPSFMAVAEVPDIEPPRPPDSVRGTGQVGRLTLAWGRAAEADLRGYRVYRASSPTGEFGLLTEAPTIEPRFADSIRVGADHAFYYRVTAVDSAFNESAPSATVAVRPPDLTPPSPPQIVAVAPGEGLLLITWATNPEADVSWYRVRHRVRGREAWTERPDSVIASTRTDTIPNLPPGELMEVSLVAIDDAGNRSEPARPMTGRPFKRRPPPVLEIRRQTFDRRNGAVAVEWETPPAEIVRLVVLRRRERDTTWVEVGSPNPAARRFEDRGVQPAQRFEYAIQAFDRFGNAAQSRVRRVSVPETGR